MSQRFLHNFLTHSIILIFLILPASSTYDLIDPSPRCYDTGYCTEYGKPGASNSIHPNSQERFDMLRTNIARLFTHEYQLSVKVKYGNDVSSRLFRNPFKVKGYCGVAAESPLWWMSEANQAARFTSWQSNTCEFGHSGATTCKTL